MKKVIFLHGFFASGSCLPALTLKETLPGKAEVLTPIVGVYYIIDKVWGLYGEKAYWVRPEKMFFEKVTRDGRTFNRFLETEI
jgi:hypothetical protein